MQLTATVLETPDPRRLAASYGTLLAWSVGQDEQTWVTLRPEVGAGCPSNSRRTAGATWPTVDGPGRRHAGLRRPTPRAYLEWRT